MNYAYFILFLLISGLFLLLRQLVRNRPFVRRLSTCFVILFLICTVVAGSVPLIYGRTAPLKPNQITWGVTFSELMANDLHLNWKEAYSSILTDLHPQTIRIVAYWSLLEKNEGDWDYSDLDWQISQAEQAHIPFILAIGERLPRWPECHYPAWFASKAASDQETLLLDYEQKVVTRYQKNSDLAYWQVENEYFLTGFAKCPVSGIQNIQKEIDQTHLLDPNHKVIVTDGGEGGSWVTPARLGDVFGFTMYRVIKNHARNDTFKSFQYFLPANYYTFRRDINRILTGKPNEKYIVVELQSEPWGPKQIYAMTPQEGV